MEYTILIYTGMIGFVIMWGLVIFKIILPKVKVKPKGFIINLLYVQIIFVSCVSLYVFFVFDGEVI